MKKALERVPFLFFYLQNMITPVIIILRNVIERDYKESSKRRFGCRTQPSKNKEKFTEKIAPFMGLSFMG
jgi:3-deoxy-D-manno-octulosonic-acid transferase